MRPTRDTFTVESTVGEQAETIRMGIAEGEEHFIMGILTDMYSDPEMAVQREYATNARDAHIAAGKADVPIRVDLPTALRPMLTITDEGVGMDADDIRTTYSQYAASTKRDSDDYNGVLGIGSKSALAYADQFTVIGRKDGRQVTVAISRDESGAGVQQILDVRDTDEPNGVAVQIPTRRDNALWTKAAELFRYWPEGSVLVDGEAPARIEGYELSPGLLVVDKSEVGERCIVVMGGVPYPAPNFFDGERAKLAGHKALVAWVDIGAVHFAPSREALMDTPTTRRTLDALRTGFNVAKTAAMQRDVDAATTRGEAMAAQVAAQDALDIDATATWRGEEVPSHVEMVIGGVAVPGSPSDDRWWYLHDTSRYHRAARSAHHRERKLPVKIANRAVWVLGFSNGTWTAAMRDKLDSYVAYHEATAAWTLNKTEYVLTRAVELPSAWLDEVRTLQWSDIRAWKDPDAASHAGGGETYAGTYGTHGGGGWRQRYPASDLAEDAGPIFYMTGEASRYEPDGGSDAAVLKDHFGADARLVVLAVNRLAKFLRLFPSARPAQAGRREAAASWWATLTKRERDALATFTSDGYYFTRAETVHTRVASEANDPELAQWNRLAATWTQDLWQGRKTHASYLPTDREEGEHVPNPLGRYPLLRDASGERGTVVEHMILYVNSVYEKENP